MYKHEMHHIAHHHKRVNRFISEESQRQSTFSTKFIKCVLLAGSYFSKSRLGIEAHRYSHLLESRLVLTSSFVERNERMCRRTSSGKLLKHLLFSSTSFSSLSFCFFWQVVSITQMVSLIHKILYQIQ